MYFLVLFHLPPYPHVFGFLLPCLPHPIISVVFPCTISVSLKVNSLASELNNGSFGGYQFCNHKFNVSTIFAHVFSPFRYYAIIYAITAA